MRDIIYRCMHIPLYSHWFMKVSDDSRMMVRKFFNYLIKESRNVKFQNWDDGMI